jgi:tetratricopeptide (TPR) repeat protein
MRRSTSLHCVAACALIAAAAACRPTDRAIETASRDTSATAEPANEVVPVTTTSDEARALYTRGLKLADQLRAHDARQLLEQAAAKDPSFALAHYDLALNSPTPKEFSGHLHEAVALSSKASEGERLMILSLQAGADGDSKKSLAYVQELATKYPRDARAQTLLGIAYTNLQEYDKAVSQLTKATTLDSTYAQAYNTLGYSYMPQGKYAEAEAAFKRYIALVPNDPNPYDSYAEMLMRTGRFDESIAQYRKALSVEPHFGSSYVGIASNFMFEGKHDSAGAQARKLYDSARDDGDRRTALTTQAIIAIDGGRTAQALQTMQKLYALDARIADTAAMSADAAQMGDILLGGGQADQAAQRYRQSLALVEGSALSGETKDISRLADHYNRARVALAKRDTATAKREAQEFAKGAQATGDVGRIRQSHELAGIVALETKDVGKAIDELGQADQQDPYVLYTLATAYRAKGDAAKAKELAGRAADMHILPTIRYALVRAKAMKMA